MILPFGTPPRPSAISRLKEPVGMVSTFMFAAESPSFAAAPFPYCFQSVQSAASSAPQFIFVIISHTEYSPYHANVRSLLLSILLQNLLCCQLFFLCLFQPQILCTGVASNISLCTSVAYSTLLPQPKNTAKNPRNGFSFLFCHFGIFSYFSECRPAYPISQLYISLSTVLRNSPRRNPVPLRGRSSCSTRVFVVIDALCVPHGTHHLTHCSL